MFLVFSFLREEWNGCKNVSMNGFVFLNYSLVKSIFFFLVCLLKGSLFIIKYNGYIENLDDLKMGILFVFYNSDILCWKFNMLGL